ncbi:fibrinogen-like protein 1-like protein [Pelobates fuscus]|uniref:fibrinogen-like protein 1-like protein n=1 Tax=Pelobates fuscus TaxID=191477 RepID=UPI002FE4AA24
MWVTCTVFALSMFYAAAQEVTNRTVALDIENIENVPDVTKIINLKDVYARKVFFARDCDELYQMGYRKHGLYIIRPDNSIMIVVQCYMHDCGGWTVIQKNSFNTEITWTVAWKTYKFTFGNMASDHWLGHYYIHLLTVQKWNKVKIILVDSKNTTRYAEYDSIYVKDEDHGYQLRLGTYSGDAGDSMTSNSLTNMHDNMKFSTHDRDNDRSYNKNCADKEGGGWWYDSCYVAQLNKQNGIHWATLCDHNCRKSIIMIAPIQMHCYRV